METKQPIYKYYYFGMYGRGELPRMLFHYAGIKFEDIRIPMKDWFDEKPKFKFGQVPVLEVDGAQISQANVIARYLGRKFGFFPADEILAIEVEELCDYIHLDINEIYNRVWFLKGDKKTEHIDMIVNNLLPWRLKFLDERLRKGNGEYLVGDSVTLADFYVLELAQRILYQEELKEKMTPVLEKLTKFVEYIKKRQEDPKFQIYLKERVDEKH